MKNYEKLVREGRAIGELDHPDSSVVELKNASHLVTKFGGMVMMLWANEGFLTTLAGKVAKQLVKRRCPVGNIFQRARFYPTTR